jgi:hypothetical protein
VYADPADLFDHLDEVGIRDVPPAPVVDAQR